MRGIARAMLFCMGFHWVKVKGKLCSSEEAPILAIAPHSSFIDALALAVICLPSGVSREENDSIPLLGGVSAFTDYSRVLQYLRTNYFVELILTAHVNINNVLLD